MIADDVGSSPAQSIYFHVIPIATRMMNIPYLCFYGFVGKGGCSVQTRCAAAWHKVVHSH